MRGGRRFREAKRTRKGLHPVWRGIGFVLLIVFAIGGYYAAGWLMASPAWPWKIPNVGLTLGPFQIPYSPVVFGPWRFTGLQAVQLVASVVVIILSYALMVVVYSAFNPVRLGETDAPPVRRKIDKSKVR